MERIKVKDTKKKDVQDQHVKKSKSKKYYCFICFSMINLRRLCKNFQNGNRIENYSDMIQRCFKIQVFEFKKEIRESACVCKECIERLRECCAFLRDIERGQKTLFASKYESDNRFKVKPTSKVISKCPEKRSGGITTKRERSSHTDNRFEKKLHKIENVKEKSSVKIEKSDNVLVKKEKRSGSFISCDNFYDDGIDSDSGKFNKDDLFEGYQSEGSWSTNTEEIYIATGYYSTNRDIPEKPTKRDRNKKPKGMKKIIPRGCTACPICQKEFKRRDYVVIHYATHCPNDLCYICGKLVTYRSQYNEHLQSHESKRDLYVCARCSKPFRCKTTLIQHMKRIHENKLLYVCPVCSERFGDSYHKRIHLRDVHGEQIKTHDCQLCNKEYVSPALLRRHLEVVHGKEKEFPCTECPKAYCKKRDLLEHMVKHTGIPINICHLCGKTFVKRSSLVKHVATHTTHASET